MPGTPESGYMPPEKGPFKCANCVHFHPEVSGCDDEEVAEDLGRGKNGLAPVKAEACCNEFEPRAKAKRGGGFGSKLVKIA